MRIDIEDIQNNDDPYWYNNLKGMLGMLDQIIRLYGNDEEKLKEYMQWDSIEIEVNLKLGNDAFRCYTCDFTHDYIDINADYRN